MMFLRIFKHLLPPGPRLAHYCRQETTPVFRRLNGDRVRRTRLIDDVWLDIFPETTRDVEAWESQFGLRDAGLTEQERRDRLAAAWQALGGQDPRYIQDTLQANGFNVYLHEWWDFIFPLDAVYCGDIEAEAGEVGAECTAATPTPRDPSSVLAPDNITPVSGKGYPLVNIITEISPKLLALCGEAEAESGEPRATCYNHVAFNFGNKQYNITTDPDTWPYYLYIGGETFGDLAQIPESRRTEFETLCLKICPNQQWIGALVEYV
jgi:Uncharacterized protein conserved in bacteria